MLTLKSEASEDLSSIHTPEASKELEHWKNVVFAFDMDRDKPTNNPNRRNTQRSRSSSTSATTGSGQRPSPHEAAVNVQDAALLAQFAAASGQLDHQSYSNLLSHPQSSYPSMAPSPGFYNNFLHHNPVPQPSQLPALSSLNFPWGQLPTMPPSQSEAGPSHYNPQQQGSSSSSASNMVPFLDPRFIPPPQPPRTGTRQGGQASSQASSAGDSAPSPEMDQPLAEEKRRRNTAASARFRVKKKHKTIALERSVSDLTGRAEELEREVTELRRENGWLKEIVMLKGAQFASSNESHREALSQAAALAAGSHHALPQGDSPSGSASAGGSTKTETAASDEEGSDEEIASLDKKGKGKKPAKGEKKG